MRIARFAEDHAMGAPMEPTQAPTILNGMLVGLDNRGRIVKADCRASAGPIKARGVLMHGEAQRDPLNNLLTPQHIGTFVLLSVVKGFVGLTPGADYYLGQDGLFSATAPGGGDLTQIVGFALDSVTMICNL